jgi:hypothetical protein
MTGTVAKDPNFMKGVEEFSTEHSVEYVIPRIGDGPDDEKWIFEIGSPQGGPTDCG